MKNEIFFPVLNWSLLNDIYLHYRFKLIKGCIYMIKIQ